MATSMGRGVSAPMKAAVATGSGKNVPAVLFIEMQLESGTLRLCTAGEPLEWNGFSWVAAGILGNVQVPAESDTGEAAGMVFELSGAGPTLLAAAQDERVRDRPVIVWLAYIDEAAATAASLILNTPLEIFRGPMDRMVITVPNPATIQVSAESQDVDQRRPREYRFNHETQIALYPGDMYFEHQLSLQDIPIVWGVR